MEAIYPYGNMGSDPGDEIQIIHPLQLFSSFPIPAADLTFLFIEGEVFQGKERANHVFSHALGLFGSEVIPVNFR